MKKSNEHIKEIQTKFFVMQNKKDLLDLLNFVNKYIYKEKAYKIKLKQLTYYADYRRCNNRYQTFFIKKKSGGNRQINAPADTLNYILRSLNYVLQCVFEPHKAATGFVPGKSIVDNAKLHIDKPYVFNIDLKDFFPSIELYRVKAIFKLPPFNLNEEKEPLSFFLANLVCHPMEVERLNKLGEWVKVIKPVLPQGAPTSPTITNIIANRLDRRLTGLAKRFNVAYSRYADDITFSSNKNIFYDQGVFIKEMERIISVESFTINSKKVRLQNQAFRQEVTGLIVNEKVNVRKRYIKQIRMWLYLWEKYGIVVANEKFINDYKTDKGHVKKGIPDIVNVLDGKLEYLKMVKGEKDPTYQKLLKRFERLRNSQDPLNNVLETWENEGIEKAMDLYYSNHKKYINGKEQK